MAGAGWKDFVPGEVLSAANVQDYLQDQSVMVFASAAARTSALASPSEGMVSYLKDTDTVERFDGSSWVVPFSVANGGTGATTVAGAQDTLRVGLVPISPTSVTAAGSGATATANTLGQITVTSATSVTVEGVFTSNYKYYRLNVEAVASTSVDLFYRFSRSNADIASGYAGSTWFSAVNATSGYQNTYTSGTAAFINYLGVSNYGYSTVEIAPLTRPQVTTRFSSTHGGYSSTGNYYIAGPATTGFTLLTLNGNWSGTFQVFGYNE